MNFKQKIIVACVGLIGLAPTIHATNLEDSFTIPSWASLGTNYGDWFTGLIALLYKPASLAVILMLAVCAVLFVVNAVASAVHKINH